MPRTRTLSNIPSSIIRYAVLRETCSAEATWGTVNTIGVVATGGSLSKKSNIRCWYPSLGHYAPDLPVKGYLAGNLAVPGTPRAGMPIVPQFLTVQKKSVRPYGWHYESVNPSAKKDRHIRKKDGGPMRV